MKIDCLNTLLRRIASGDATITKVDHPTQSIFFKEEGREWVVVFDGTAVVGVWDMTGCGGDHWDEQAQDQQEAVGF